MSIQPSISHGQWVLLAIISVDKADRVQCQCKGCGQGIYAAVHMVALPDGEIQCWGSDCYADQLLTRYQQMFGDRGLSTEVRYLNGQVWQPGMPVRGSIRLDVVEGPPNAPTSVFDYKFGGATLSPGRVTQIRAGANLGPSVPVLEVKP